MPEFLELPVKEYAQVYKEDTDKTLPQKLDSNLRYAFFSTIATGGKVTDQVLQGHAPGTLCLLQNPETRICR